MAATPTTRLGLNKQADGDQNWGAVNNTGLDNADARIFRQSADYSFTPAIDTEVFSGSGLDDASSGGTMTGDRDLDIVVEIDSEGSPDTFRWSKDGGATFEAEDVDITGSAQSLVDGVTITFAATTGHTLGDSWAFEAHSGDPQDPNDIDGAGTPLTANYVGQRYYAELDGVWWVCESTGPSVWVKEDVLVQALTSVDKNSQKAVSVDPDTGVISVQSSRIHASIIQPGNALINGYAVSDIKGGLYSDVSPTLAENFRIFNADFWAAGFASNYTIEECTSELVSSLPAGLLPLPIPSTHVLKMKVDLADTKFGAFHFIDPRKFQALAGLDYCSLRVWLAADNAGSAATLAKARVGLIARDVTVSAANTLFSAWGAEGVNPSLSSSASWIYKPRTHVTIPALDWVEVYIPNIPIAYVTNYGLWFGVWADVGTSTSTAVNDNLWILGAALCPENTARFVQHPPCIRDVADEVDKYARFLSTSGQEPSIYFSRGQFDSGATDQRGWFDYGGGLNPFYPLTRMYYDGDMTGTYTKNLDYFSFIVGYGNRNGKLFRVDPVAAGEVVLHADDDDMALIDAYGINAALLHVGGTFTGV